MKTGHDIYAEIDSATGNDVPRLVGKKWFSQDEVEAFIIRRRNKAFGKPSVYDELTEILCVVQQGVSLPTHLKKGV